MTYQLHLLIAIARAKESNFSHFAAALEQLYRKELEMAANRKE